MNACEVISSLTTLHQGPGPGSQSQIDANLLGIRVAAPSWPALLDWGCLSITGGEAVPVGAGCTLAFAIIITAKIAAAITIPAFDVSLSKRYKGRRPPTTGGDHSENRFAGSTGQERTPGWILGGRRGTRRLYAGRLRRHLHKQTPVLRRRPARGTHRPRSCEHTLPNVSNFPTRSAPATANTVCHPFEQVVHLQCCRQRTACLAMQTLCQKRI